MKIATWNINGIKARHERLQAWVTRHQPDALCLQEIKTEDAGFPVATYEALGYHVVTFGQKSYNGVAILSKQRAEDVERGFGDGVEDPQARFLSATVAGLRISSAYVPNGEALTSEKYPYKLAWLERLSRYVSTRIDGARWAICGDYNIAPSDLDVHDPVAWAGDVLVSKPEREAFERLIAAGFVDVLRKVHPDKQMFTWWDYRALGFQKNKGLRIDHVLATAQVADEVTSALVDRDERKGQQPSDHAPVVVELRDLAARSRLDVEAGQRSERREGTACIRMRVAWQAEQRAQAWRDIAEAPWPRKRHIAPRWHGAACCEQPHTRRLGPLPTMILERAAPAMVCGDHDGRRGAAITERAHRRDDVAYHLVGKAKGVDIAGVIAVMSELVGVTQPYPEKARPARGEVAKRKRRSVAIGPVVGVLVAWPGGCEGPLVERVLAQRVDAQPCAGRAPMATDRDGEPRRVSRGRAAEHVPGANHRDLIVAEPWSAAEIIKQRRPRDLRALIELTVARGAPRQDFHIAR